MAWNMSAAKRRALVKLQLRDKNGRWIEMGRGVKWYSSKRKKEIGGTVVGSQGDYALVRLNKENPTHEPALVKVPARNIEVVSSKATLSDPKAEKSNLETPEFEKPEAVGRKSSNAFVKPSDTPEDYSISETSDGHTYISRKDGAQLYFPARSLDIGDELIAPDGGDETKPFSMGKAWAKKGAERLNTAGPKTGKVISIEGDRYAIVQLPEGHTVDDKKRPGEQTDKVTVGLSNSVIKLTPGLKAALGDKLAENFTDNSQNDGEEEELDPASPDAQSDHIGREVTDEQLAEEIEDEDLQEPEEKPTKSVATLKGKALDELEFGVENMEADGVDPGLRIKGTKVEIYDYDDAIRTIDGPLGVAQDNLDHGSEDMTPAERTAARSKIRGLTALKEFIEEEQETEAAATEAPQSADNGETPPEAASPSADAPEATEQAADSALNENGLTAEDQKLADGYVRMAKRADDKGDFEAADRYQALADALFKKGEDQKSAPAEEEPAEQPTPSLVEPTDPETPEDSVKFDEIPKEAPEGTPKLVEPDTKPELPPLVEGEELELPIPGVKKQGKRTDKSAQHLKTLEALEEGDRVSYTNAHDETSTYQKHPDGTWDLLDPEDEWEDENPLEEALTADQIAQRHKRGDLVVETAEEREEAERVATRAANENRKKYEPIPTKPIDKSEKVGPTRAEQEQAEANSADKPWSVGEIQGTMRDWFDFAQAVKNGDTRAIETMANNKRTGDEETDIIVNDKGQPVDITLTYNDDGDPVVRLSNFDDSKDIYGDFEIDASVMPKHLATLIHESINADDIAAAVTERNGAADRELDEREADVPAAPIVSRYAGEAKSALSKAIEDTPDSGMELDGNYANVTDLDKAQDFLRDLVSDIQAQIDDPGARKAGKVHNNRTVRDLRAILNDVNDKQVKRDGQIRPNRALRDETPTPEAEVPEVPEAAQEAAKPPMPVYPDTVDPNQFPYEFVPRGTIITHSKTGKKRVVVRSSRQDENTPRDHITTRNMRDGKPFGPVLDSAPGDFDEREELQRLLDEPETSTPEVDTPTPEVAPEPELDETDSTPEEVSDTVEESEPVNPLDALDIVRREPMAIDGEAYPPTQQQQDVIDAVLAGLDTKVQAMAGTGKTSTLVALSRRIKEHGKQAIYIAFNKTVQTEAEERMEGLPVEAKTGHGVAYQWALKSAPHLIARLNGKDYSRPIKTDKNGKASDWADKKPITASRRIADMLNISNGDIKDENGNDFKATTTVLAVKKTVESFALSDKDEVDLAHVPESFEIREEDQQKIVDLAKEYWDDLTKEDGNFRITHDVYRKQWALSRPDLTDGSGGNKKGANILYIDEAQDTPPVLAKVVADQKMQKVIVGDPNQAIYAFAENIDYLSEADGDVELPLNKSWRFGPQVADIGNRFLQVLGSNDRVVGGGGDSAITYGMEDADAVLVRTNAGMVNAILQEVRNGRKVSAPNGTRENLDSLTRTVQGLMADDPIDNPHDDLIGFKNWGEVLNAYNNGDNNVSMIVKLYDVVDAYSLTRLTGEEIANLKKRKMEDAVKAVDNLVITVPKSETIEITQEGDRTWLSPVEVHPDPKMADKWTGNTKKYAVKNFSQELGKVRAPEAFDKSLSWPQQMEEYHRQGGLGKLGFRFDSRSGRWYTDDAEAAQKIRSFTGEFDVTVSTAHKSKGLEWDRVRIGDDFFVPKEKDGQVEMVEDGELKLGYVAVTRAAKELDPGPLSWVFDSQYSEPNGGDPNKQRPVATPEETQDVVPEAPEDTTPAPEQVTEEAPIEVTPDTEESLEETLEETTEETAVESPYDEDGLTPTEASRVAELDQQMADIYSGKSDAELKPVENEWNDILAHGERRKKGEDLPEYEHPVDVEEAPEVAPEPEAAPEPVVEEAPEPEVIPEPVVEPTPEVAPEPEYDAEGLTTAERARTDALEQAIYDAYRARKPETAKHLDTELQEILARGAQRLKRQKSAPVDEAPVVADKPKRKRTDYSGVPVHDASGTEIKAGDTIGHKRLGPVVVTGFLPAAGRVTFIDPSTNKEASVKASTISILPANDVEAPEAPAPKTGEPGERFTDLTTGKQGFYGANGEPIIVGQRVTTSDGRSGLVKSVYTAKSGVAWIPVQWDDSGKITRVYGNLLSLEGGSDGGNGGGGSPEPEAPEPTAPEVPEVSETPSVPDVAPALSIKDSVENYSGTEGFASSYDPENFSGNPLSASGIRRFEEVVEGWSELRRDMVTQYEKGADGSVLTHGVKTWSAKTGEYVGLVQNVELYDDDISIRIYKTKKDFEAEKDRPGYDPEYHSKSAVYDPKDLISKPPTLWDGSYVDFSKAGSVAEINASLFQHYPSVHFHISENLQLAQAKLLAKAISANFRKFPMLENSMNEVTTEVPDDGSVASLASIQPSAAVFSDQSLNINPYSAAEFKQHVNDGRGSWFNDVPNGKQADYIITHEMGHALDGLTGWIGSARVYELLREYLAEQGITGLSNSELAKYLVDNGMISEYSAEMWKQGIDPDEMVAEAFADVEINGINAKPVNKMIHKELMTRLEGMMQG